MGSSPVRTDRTSTLPSTEDLATASSRRGWKQGVGEGTLRC